MSRRDAFYSICSANVLWFTTSRAIDMYNQIRKCHPVYYDDAQNDITPRNMKLRCRCHHPENPLKNGCDEALFSDAKITDNHFRPCDEYKLLAERVGLKLMVLVCTLLSFIIIRKNRTALNDRGINKQ